MHAVANSGSCRTRCQQPLPAVSKEISQRVHAVGGCGDRLKFVRPLHSVRSGRCLAVHSVSRTSDFVVREITDKDIQTLTDVQTDAFFEPAPIPFLNGFFRSLFRVRFFWLLVRNTACTMDRLDRD